jgi:hypothetical protein
MFTVLILLGAAHPTTSLAQSKPISLSPDNPHYFLYKKKPTVLITSAEHYGAVINLEFDFVPYLDELKSKGLNLTRVFTGAYVEPPGAFNITENTLAPRSAVFICPWQRSTQNGYAGGGNKFDLTKWNEVYFKRLKEFMSAAEKRNIIVELAFFCPFYEDIQWKISPMNANNNINEVGNVLKDDVYTMDKHGGLLPFQEAMVRKIVNELTGFENIIYEICNEPYFGGVKMEWQHHIASLIRETENKLKVKHLISQNIANDSARIVNPHAAVSVFNFHYASPPIAIKQNYHLNKVIGNNETGFRGQQDSTYRKEGWEFILAGGALYNNLDYSFTANHESGNFVYPEKQPGGGTTALRTQLGYLKSFIDSFDFVRMKPDGTFITEGLPAGVRAYVLSEKGKQYAAYLLHGTQVDLSLVLLPGTYAVEWMNPSTGVYSKKEMLKHPGGVAKISSPDYNFDIALKVVRSKN